MFIVITDSAEKRIPFRTFFFRDLTLVFQILPLVHAAIFPMNEDGEDSSRHISEQADGLSNSGKEEAADLAVCVDAPDGGGSNGVMVMAGFWAARRCAGHTNSSVVGYSERAGKACMFLSDVLERC